MKRFFLLIILLITAGLTYGQLTVTVPTMTATVGQTISIPVTLTGASASGIPISSANIQITYDTAVLSYVNLTNFYAGTPQGQWFFGGANGIVAANWLEPNLLTLAIPDGTALYNIQFTYKGGSSPLVFIINEFTDALYNIVPTTAVNGAVNPLPVFRQVTFTVDMTNEIISPSGVFLNGSFNNWSYSANPMGVIGLNLFSTTLTLQESDSYAYFYVNGVDTLGAETVPAACGVPNGSGAYLRNLTVPAADSSLNLVCFSECDSCGNGIPRQVTFRVDMSRQPVSPNGVHIAGNFNNWSLTDNPMTLTTDSIYALTLTLTEGVNCTYRFINGNDPAGFEIVPDFCGVPSGTGVFNRLVEVPSHDTTLIAVCFSQCDTCVNPNPSEVFVTFRVDMSQTLVSPKGVHLAGDFQGWDPTANEMVEGIGGTYYLTLQLPMDSTYEFLFINGDEMSNAETVPAGCSVNGHRYIGVEFADTVLKAVCYTKCIECSVSVPTEEDVLPMLGQSYPNPAESSATIRFFLPEPGFMKMVLFNIYGTPIKVLAEGEYLRGQNFVEFETASLPSGIYLYQMIYKSSAQTLTTNRKLTVR